ncbi:unnamed protein product [Vitrella brassicaformis CCMP3155]|uniref:Uncharacterized protein n=2 Tax=Vitrella brassicaformis TaxID=1169539 RepID=A0A0G4EVL3_VITBC|nr:unnamed protein product [Vitrella brassicaformis CCMP3155]|eukprot:CEM02681.1 unnamed protein product [Vitrella brassicaformis CCMP3155]
MASGESAGPPADAKSAVRGLADQSLLLQLRVAGSDARLQAAAARGILSLSTKCRPSPQLPLDEFKQRATTLSQIKAAQGVSDLVDAAIFTLLSSAMPKMGNSSMRDHLLTDHVDLVRRAEAAFAKAEAAEFLIRLYHPVSPLAHIPPASWMKAFDMVVDMAVSDAGLTGRAFESTSETLAVPSSSPFYGSGGTCPVYISSTGDSGGRLLSWLLSNRIYGTLGHMTRTGAQEQAMSAVRQYTCPHAARLVDVLVSDTAPDPIKWNAFVVLGFIFASAHMCTRGPEDSSQLRKVLKEPTRLLLKDDMRGLKATAEVLKKCYEIDLLDVEGDFPTSIPLHLVTEFGHARHVLEAGYLPALLSLLDDERFGRHRFHGRAMVVGVMAIKHIVASDSTVGTNADVAAMLCRLLRRHATGEVEPQGAGADVVIDDIVEALLFMLGHGSDAMATDLAGKMPQHGTIDLVGSSVIAQQTMKMLSEWVPGSGPHRRLKVHPKVACLFEMLKTTTAFRANVVDRPPDRDQTPQGRSTTGRADAAQRPARSGDNGGEGTHSTDRAAPASPKTPSSPLDKWKDIGNALFGKHKYLDAYRAYMKGVRLANLEPVSELLVRRAQCRMGVGDCVGAMIDVTTALRILPPPPSVEPGSKSAIIQQTAVEVVYTPLVMRWLNGLDTATGGGDVMVLPSEETTAAFMKDAMQYLSAQVEAAGPSEPLEVANALAAGEQLQEEGRYAEARDTFTAGLAGADVSTLIALLSNASACLLKPELTREGGPDAVGCAAAALHLSCLHHDPSQQPITIQQKCLVRLGQGLLAERLFDAADVIGRAIKKHASQGQMRIEADTLHQRVRTHRANANGFFDWAAIYRQQLDSNIAMQHGRPPTSIDVAEYVGPVAVRHDEAQQPSLYAKEDIQVGQLLLVQKPVVLSSGDFASLTSSDGYRQLMAACKDGWHPRLVSQLCCLSEGQRRLPALAAPPSHETCLGLAPGFPLLPRFIQSHGAEEFGSPVAQVDGDSIPQLVTFNHRTSGTIRSCFPGVLSAPDDIKSSLASGVWILPSLIRHARFDRNAIWYVVGDLLVVRCVRPISGGGGVTADYFDDGYVFDANDCVDNGDAISMAERWAIPSPVQHYERHSQEAITAISMEIHRVTTLRRGGTSRTAVQRDWDALVRKVETLQQSMPSDVPTMGASQLHIFRGALLAGLGRHEEASEAAIEAVKTARAVRSIAVEDCRCLSTAVRSAPHGSQLCHVMLEELRSTCALLLGTREAATIIFLNEQS